MTWVLVFIMGGTLGEFENQAACEVERERLVASYVASNDSYSGLRSIIVCQQKEYK